MTCVLSTPWQPFDSGNAWSSMNQIPGSSNPAYGDRSHSQYGYASSDTDSRKTSGGSGKKRASRAGTRSVSTLSSAQLERKRANDREAQRAIRQRTKDHIDGLERTVHELRNANESNENMVVMTQRRNRELEEENGYLRNKLGETGYQVNLQPPERQRQPEVQALPAHAASPAIQTAPVGSPLGADSDASSRSLSLATSHSSASRAGSWQVGPSNYTTPTSNPPMAVAIPGSMPIGHNLTAWRSHDSSASVQSTPTAMQHPSQSRPQTPYTTSNPSDRPQWAAPAQPYSYQEAPRPQAFEAPPPPSHQYAQPTAQVYSGSPAPSQPHVYQQQPPAPPHAEFQGMQVSSPAGYQVPPQQQTFAQPAQYSMPQVAPPPPGSEYGGQPGQMQPPPPPQTAYHHGHDGQQYSAQGLHPPMQFREDPSAQGYPMNHYPGR